MSVDQMTISAPDANKESSWTRMAMAAYYDKTGHHPSSSPYDFMMFLATNGLDDLFLNGDSTVPMQPLGIISATTACRCVDGLMVNDEEWEQRLVRDKEGHKSPFVVLP